MPTSPSTLNYSVLKGIVKFTPTGGAERDLGNAPEFELTPAIDKLDHFSSRAGVRSKDRSVVREKTLNGRMVLDENTPENLQLALLGGDSAVNTGGNTAFGIFENSEITGALTFTGTNDIGNKVHLSLPNVSLIPAGSLPFISDEWAQMEVNFEVLFDEEANDFGTCEVEETTESV
jgi:hypothetical protein